ncbi:MAG: hypothetical protein EAZ97_01065 [Bacteroidetes bacterium]|nr:MAG: hypothetical protein EAZ97_01065 [Bacteroidota bacterium]
MPFAKYVAWKQQKWALQAEKTQENVFQYLVKTAKETQFGKDHDFQNIRTYQDFVQRVPVRDYEDFQKYIDLIIEGWQDVLWIGKPAYFAKTSGTTSGTKYIPLSKESVPFHIQSARDGLLSYIAQTGKSRFLDKKLIFLSGSPELDKKGSVLTGRLSGIVNHHVPKYLRTNQLPDYQTNCIEDWEEKLDKIILQTVTQPMSLISGIPPWVQMYFDKINQRTGQYIKDIFPNFELFVYGGVNFEPYKAKLFDSIGKKVDSLETYPASEGFIAYQDSQYDEGLLLLLNHGIFYEFIPADEYFSPNPRRLSIEQVEIGVNYALIMNTNAGLWGYSIGDTVKFVSKNPYRILVTGRIKHFISAFGEHVIAEEVEKAMQLTMQAFPETEIVEFTVAPNVAPTTGLPHHEWLVAFAKMPSNLAKFAETLDANLRKLNVYYDDLIVGNILRKAVLRVLAPDAFIQYMKSKGKLGGQNKVPRLANHREIAEELLKK